MPAKATVWTVVWLENTDDEKPFLATEIFEDQKSLEARIVHFASVDADYVVTAGPVLPLTVDTSPRITIGDAEAPVKKTRAKRRSSAEVAAEKQAKAEAKKANNGAGGVLGDSASFSATGAKS